MGKVWLNANETKSYRVFIWVINVILIEAIQHQISTLCNLFFLFKCSDFMVRFNCFSRKINKYKIIKYSKAEFPTMIAMKKKRKPTHFCKYLINRILYADCNCTHCLAMKHKTFIYRVHNVQQKIPKIKTLSRICSIIEIKLIALPIFFTYF